MSETVEQLIVKLKDLPDFIKEVCENTIEDNESDLLDFNKEQLLVRGIDTEGDSLGEYAPKSKELREAAGLQTDHIDLRFTGEFQDSIKLEKKGELSYDFAATDPKWENELAPRWPDALGLDPVNEDGFTAVITSNLEFQLDNHL